MRLVYECDSFSVAVVKKDRKWVVEPRWGHCPLSFSTHYDLTLLLSLLGQAEEKAK